MTEFLRVKNWREHQHYKNKSGAPPWIKLYRKTLTDYTFRGLAEADRFKLIGLWLLASENDGIVPNDGPYIAGCIGVKRLDLDLFVSRGFLERVYTDSRDGLAPREVEVEKNKNLAFNASEMREGQDRASAAVKNEVLVSLEAARLAKEAS